MIKLATNKSLNKIITRSQTSQYSSPKLKSIKQYKDYILDKIFNDKHLLQKETLRHNKLFHKLNKSPVKELNKKASLIEQKGSCAYCLKLYKQNLLTSNQNLTQEQVDELVDEKLFLGELAEEVKRPTYYCNACGFPTHCCEEHFNLDKEHTEVVCSKLYERNLDEHDLSSGREFPEFEYPMHQLEDNSINFLDWSNFLYTRKYESVDELFSLRHVVGDLTYPVTVASMLYESPPLRFYQSLTYEGKKSVSALRYTIDKSQQTEIVNRIRVFVLCPYYASRIPQEVYQEINYILPGISFKLYFIGPDVNLKPVESNQNGKKHKYITRDMRLEYIDKNFVECYTDFSPFDPYRDLFVVFNPELKIQSNQMQWKEAIRIMLKTKCLIAITSPNISNLKRDVEYIENNFSLLEDMDFLLRPIENPFADLNAKPNIEDLSKPIHLNKYIYSIRGKKHEVLKGFKLPLFLKQ